MTKKLALLGILLCGIYFLTVVVFVATKSQTWQAIFEIITMFSAIYFVLLIISFPFAKDDNKQAYKLLAITFFAALLVLTSIVHVSSLTLMQLIKNGTEVPDYFQLGKTPSVMSSIEYLGWGIFLGLAFLISSYGIEKNKNYKPLKDALLICAVMCFLGFFGWLVNEYLWYIASAGYGIGTVIICIEILLFDRKMKNF